MDAIQRKKEVQKMHDILKESVAGIQRDLNNFPPAMYVDERIAGLGVSLIKNHIVAIVEAMMAMRVPAKVVADTFMNVCSNEKEQEIILLIVALVGTSSSNSSNSSNDSKTGKE